MSRDQTTLLVGNDINNIVDNNSWKQLLKNIVEHLDVSKEVDIKNLTTKPFPLLYEEILLKALAKHNSIRENDVKGYIASVVNLIRPNAVHERIMKLQLSDIMTTNYEYSLQRSIDSRKTKSLGYVKERTYNIFRHNRIENTNVWHVHGECNSPRSITLGYEHYGGMLQHMRNYVATGTDYEKKKNLLPLVRRITKNQLGEHSWIDLFFTKDIHIIGLSLDTSEIDLWWLLTYRARYILQKGNKALNNKIYYYYPTLYKTSSREKLELLAANQVLTTEVKNTGNDKLKYYNSILDKIS